MRVMHMLLMWSVLLQGAGDSAFVGQNKLFPFSTVVFTSWDYHLTDVKAARNLRNSIRNQLAEMVFDAELADAYISRGKRIVSIMLKVDPLLSSSLASDFATAPVK